MRIDSSGNVGIGTTSPAAKLTVNDSGTGLSFTNAAGGSFNIGLLAGVADVGAYIFQRANSAILIGTNNTEKMRITSTGNVGIGTTAPSRKLSIGGTGIIGLGFEYTPSDQEVSGTFVNTDTGEVKLYCDTNYFYTFYTNNAERMRIDSSGNVLVGKTTLPSSSVFGFAVNNSSNNFPYLMNSVNTTGAGGHFEFYNPNGKVGEITTSGSATTYATSSDYRLKEDVAPMVDALNKVALLKPVTYKWKIDGSEGQGFIAHELQEVVAGCVTGEKDAVDADGNPQYQGIDTSFLVATLTAAIQEMKAIIDTQSVTINDLKARIETLETK
jgi:hypothetical protein